MIEGRGFEFLLERRENFLLQDQLSVLTLISVSVPLPCDDEVLLSVLRCQLTYLGQVVTSAKARFNNSLRPRKPEGSLGRTAQDVHLDSHTAPEL